jgi:non-ribosomal peptide synthetase component F/thioesterase domain-containing protein/acyl carrier protein/precorrin-6B methylase 2
VKIFDLQFDAPGKEKARIDDSGREGASFEDLFADVVGKYPARTALTDGERSLSFAELDALSSAIARFILKMGYGPEAAIGVHCRRGGLVLAAGIGAMRAGAVYVPVDTELPLARKETMLRPARLIITDSSCLRESEYFQYRLPHAPHIICLDSPAYESSLERGGELGRVAFWESVAEGGPDSAWKSYFDGQRVPDALLESLAANILVKTGFDGRKEARVLDIGSGSGTVSRVLMDAASRYTAVDLSRTELERLEERARAAAVKVHQMEAVDICFLADEEYDLINLHAVVENFPGYNYLRTVLDHAVAKLSRDGAMFVGAVWDLDRKDRFRDALREHAQESGNNAGLIRFDAAAELFVPESFFTTWAEESSVPVEVFVFRPNVDCAEISDFRFDVVIRRTEGARKPCVRTRFGTDDVFVQSDAALPAVSPEQAAYIVYTSGSTGVPKGVVVEHQNLLHILRALAPYSSGCERVALVAPLSFDASIQQVALSLMVGKTLSVLPDSQRKSPENFYDSVCRNKIDLCDMTPAFFNVLVEFLWSKKKSLPIKKMLIAGEILRSDSVGKFFEIPGNEGVVIYNVYGPTECTVDSSAYRIDYGNRDAFSSFPIGPPLEGVTVTIRDKDGTVVPESESGEIWISGAGVCRGYLDIENSAAFVMAEGRRWYRTGDYGFARNNLLFYLGREDQQVKIRGNRVEIGEVENAVAGFPGVRQVAVVADTFEAHEEKSLAAYIVGEFDSAKLQIYLEQMLPSHCVPSHFVPMVELPFSLNRKVDKKALPSPLLRKHESGGRRLSGPTETKLAEIWKRLLGVEVSDADANFFSLGGHSILAIRLIVMIEKEMDLRITLNELFSHPTISELAEFFEGKRSSSDSPVIKLCHCDGGKNIFLFHPVGGSVFCYGELAKLLGHKYSVFAVEAAGFSHEKTSLNTELHRVEDLAAYYLEEILKIETEDIIFGGWSFGGLLAYEVACRYERMGHDAEIVLILDSVADNSRAKQEAGQDEIDLLKSLLQESLEFDENVLRSLPRDKRLRYLLECGERTGLLPFGFSSVQMDNLLSTYRSNAIAAARYEMPAHSTKNILLVRALEMTDYSRSFINDQYFGWSKFLKEENITLKWTEGTHETMLSPGLVGNVANHILEYIENV